MTVIAVDTEISCTKYNIIDTAFEMSYEMNGGVQPVATTVQSQCA